MNNFRVFPTSQFFLLSFFMLYRRFSLCLQVRQQNKSQHWASGKEETGKREEEKRGKGEKKNTKLRR